MATYPEEGKVNSPDDVGERRMPKRETYTHVADADLVQYHLSHYDPETKEISKSHSTGDLGQALKAMKKAREIRPGEDFQLHGN